MNIDDKLLYEILEVKYLETNNRKITYKTNENDDLYPKDWALLNDYQLKSKILIEAIQNKKTIMETNIYQSIMEGVRNKSR